MRGQMRTAPGAALAGILFASATLLLYLGRHFTFIQDTWAFLLDRPGINADAFFKPHNEHIVVIPVAIEKLLIAVFGMTSALPERIVLTAMLLATGALVFVYVRRRLGPWPAVIATALLLFLGPSWSVLLWPFEIVIVGSVLTGVAMLLLLEREDRLGDAMACLMLTLSVLCSSLGAAFIAAAAVDLWQRRRERGWSRAWVTIVPLLLYAAWYAGWGHEAEHHLTLNNVLHSPVYLLEGFASSLDSLLGLSTIDVNDVGRPEWGRPLLLAAIALAVYGQVRRPGFPRRLWPVAGAAAAYWLLAGFNYFPGREPVAGRYGYAGATFVLLIGADLLKGLRITRTALLVAGGVAVLAIGSNLVAFRNGRDWLENVSVLTRGDTGAIVIAERTIDPNFSLTPELAGTPSLFLVNAGHFLEVVREHGSPGYSPEELAAAPEYARRQADIILANALPLSTVTLPDTYSASGGGGCAEIEPGAETRLVPGTTRIEVAPGRPASLQLRRFAQGEYPVKPQDAPGGSTTRLVVPRDKAPQPWALLVGAEQTVRVCSPS
jgi:hypothetical protein